MLVGAFDFPLVCAQLTSLFENPGLAFEGLSFKYKRGKKKIDKQASCVALPSTCRSWRVLRNEVITPAKAEKYCTRIAGDIWLTTKMNL